MAVHLCCLSIFIIVSDPRFCFTSPRPRDVMDVYVLLDAVARCIASEEKELCKIAELTLTFVVETAATIVGDREKVLAKPCGSTARICWAS